MSRRFSGLVVRGKSEEAGARLCEGESAHESPPLLSCFTGAHHIPVGPITRPTIPSSDLLPWRRTGVGGGRGHKFRASRTRAKDKVKASRIKAKMSLSGSEGAAPASIDHFGEHGGPPGTRPAPVRGVIPDVALPASEVGDAPPRSLLAPAMFVLLYRIVVSVLPAPPEAFNTAERLQQSLAVRSDFETSWTREQRRGSLTLLDATALVSADRAAREFSHSTPGFTLEADRAPCVPGFAWTTRLAGLPDCLIRDPSVHYDSTISAPVIRAAVEDDYPGWLATTVSRVKALAAPPA